MKLALSIFRKMASPTINLTASSTANDAESTQALSSNLVQQSFWRFSDGAGERGGRSGRRGNGCDGRSSIQCQGCHKFGHDASICYHRFKKDYTLYLLITSNRVTIPIPLIIWLMLTFPNHPCHGSLNLALYHGLIILELLWISTTWYASTPYSFHAPLQLLSTSELQAFIH